MQQKVKTAFIPIGTLNSDPYYIEKVLQPELANGFIISTLQQTVVTMPTSKPIQQVVVTAVLQKP